MSMLIFQANSPTVFRLFRFELNKCRYRRSAKRKALKAFAAFQLAEYAQNLKRLRFVQTAA